MKIRVYVICGEYNTVPGLKQICDALKNGNFEDIDYVANISYERFKLLNNEMLVTMRSKYSVNEDIASIYLRLCNYNTTFFSLDPAQHNRSSLVTQGIKGKDLVLFMNTLTDGADVINIANIYKDFCNSFSVMAISVNRDEIQSSPYFSEFDIIWE